MKSLTFLFISAFVAFASVQSFAQDSNSWGDTVRLFSGLVCCMRDYER